MAGFRGCCALWLCVVALVALSAVSEVSGHQEVVVASGSTHERTQNATERGVGVGGSTEEIMLEDMIIVRSKFSTQSTKFSTAFWNSEPTQQWRSHIIPYTINAGMPTASTTAIRAAIQHINDRTCVKITETADTTVERIKYQFNAGAGCSSGVGKISGGPTVTIGSNCPRSVLIHETLHALGLFHTHQRRDRDRFIQFVDNVAPGQDDQYSLQSSATALMTGEYDYRSVMHYTPQTFSDNTGPTFRAPTATGMSGLAESDVDLVNWIFLDCPASGKRLKCISSYPFEQKYPSVPKVAVGKSLVMDMNVNYGPQPLTDATTRVTYTATTGVTVGVASGATISAPAAVTLTFTPTAAQAGSLVSIPIAFSTVADGLTATCTQAVWVLPQLPTADTGVIECFGQLPSSSQACNGRGSCVALDTCSCQNGFFGKDCGLVVDPLPNNTALYDGMTGTTGSSGPLSTRDYSEDYTLGATIASTGVQDAILKEIHIAAQLSAGSSITLRVLDSAGQLFMEEEFTVANAVGSNGYFISRPNTGFQEGKVIPLAGRVELSCSSCFWSSTSTAVALGTDNTAVGTAAPLRHRFRIYGAVVCRDGRFGANCANTCPGGESSNQCGMRGLCSDGVRGSGQCNCFAGSGVSCSTGVPSVVITPPTQPAVVVIPSSQPIQPGVVFPPPAPRPAPVVVVTPVRAPTIPIYIAPTAVIPRPAPSVFLSTPKGDDNDNVKLGVGIGVGVGGGLLLLALLGFLLYKVTHSGAGAAGAGAARAAAVQPAYGGMNPMYNPYAYPTGYPGGYPASGIPLAQGQPMMMQQPMQGFTAAVPDVSAYPQDNFVPF